MGRLNDIIGEYAKKNPVRFHVPGHKGKSENYNNPDYSLDVTELFFTDNLYNPSHEINLIYELENRISKCFFKIPDIFSLISCSGATLCIQASILALVKLKQSKKANKNLYIICDRASHISFVNIISLLNITPLWIYPGEDFIKKINYFAQNENFQDIIGVFVTSPDYFGVMKNIWQISQECKKYLLNLVVDNSHGSHLAFYKNGELHPINLGADISVDSIHKTLPVLTGAAILHANKKFDIDSDKTNILKESINVFASTSPSYLILQSIEKMVDLLEKHGTEEHKRLIHDINLFKNKTENLGFEFDSDKLYDPYRIVLNCENAGEKLYYFLAERNILCEFFNKDRVILIPSIFNSSGDFEKLFDGLEYFAKINKIIPVKHKKNIYPPGVPTEINMQGATSPARRKI